MFENIKEMNGSFYRGSIPFVLINKNKKIIYISSSNKNINDYYFAIDDFSKIKKLKIENYNYTEEEFRGKNYELIQFFESDEKGIVFLSVDSLFKKYFKKGKSIILEKGKEYKINEVRNFLSENGFENNYLVEKKGEFSLRGDILDIFPLTEKEPLRFEFFDNQLEEIRYFDIDSQKSLKKIERVEIFGNIGRSEQYSFMNLIKELGLKNYEFMLENEELIDYKFEEYLLNFRDKEEELREEFFKIKSTAKKFELKRFTNEDIENFSDINYIKNLSKNSKITIFTEEQKRYKEIFEKYPVKIDRVPHFEGFKIGKELILTDRELKGIRIKRSEKRTEALKLNSINQIRRGDYVIHENYGVGIFLRIEIIDNRDYISIKYADEDKLYVPIEGINKIERYISEPGIIPEIYKLGRKGFRKKREKLRKDIEEYAKELLEIQAKREANNGFKFSADTVWQEEFEEGFPYNETKDQSKAIQEVKNDMESYKIMDRIVCGDVGYGKTEVALRAAFKATMDQKQVVLLAPTTVLAHQHYERFMERFKNFPLNIKLLSRLEGEKEQRIILEEAKIGGIDILIGTHRLLSGDVKFKDLGLVIIDEEQKFGVKAKEALKKLRVNVDMLTLTATPIPRTLNLALLGIRDISIIETAPTNRIPVETDFLESDAKKVKEVIMKEISREGQIFYLYNSVQNMKNKLNELIKIVPGHVKIDYIHGRMTAGEIKRKIHSFENGEFDILLTTTIIENGIDIENANTIIIEGIDKLGLSQIYQLRGRVGRGGRKAYCYLLVDSGRKFSNKTEQRKETLLNLGDIGAGFQLSLEDMRIRGAGEILGDKQHGAIESFGYDLYIKMLEEEMKKIKGIKIEENDVILEIKKEGYIPDEYIREEEKIVVYKRILQVSKLSELLELKNEIKDRFGKIPVEVENLFKFNKIKIMAKNMGIRKIEEREGQFIVSVNENLFNVEKLQNLVMNGKVKYLGKEKAVKVSNIDEFLGEFEEE
ncbi:MAG: transcription-repair coupling factor [Fusobacteriaceae bacterium]|nr:transcription-repair coupling factor [Fusobacteriaceae bacterium]